MTRAKRSSTDASSLECREGFVHGLPEWLASLPPDSVAAGDGRLRRVTIFDADGEFARGFATASAVDAASRPFPRDLWAFSRTAP